MSLSIHESHYYLRSQSDKHTQRTQTSLSPTTPPMDIIHNTNTHDSQTSNSSTKNTTNTTNTTKPPSKKRRKRRFSQLNNNSLEIDENEDIDLSINTNKKAKLSRTIKFTLNLYPIISREVSLSATSEIIKNAKKRRDRAHKPRIEEYELIGPRTHRRNPYLCRYSFFAGYECGIKATLGARDELRAAMKILSQDLVSGRAKASVQTQKNTCLVYIKTSGNKLIGCGILHIDHVWKRVNIEMFAVDVEWRGNGFASIMVYLIQYRMLFYNKYDLFVCAANDAIPFWSNRKYNFVFAHKGILEQHEVEDEKKGGTKHLIWYGTPIQARCALLKCFKQTQ